MRADLGLPLPADDALPPQAATGRDRPFSVYLHVPYCRVRCGYCDFNTYTNLTMGQGASAADYVTTLGAELGLAARAMDGAGLGTRQVSTLFLGGGTPTILAAEDLVRMRALVASTWGVAPGAEVTTEANPETVDQAYLEALARGGFTRVSFGMQSAAAHVLATLDRTHSPQRVPQVVAWARQAGLATSVDLIYGTPGESKADWEASLQAAIDTGADHVSAYALVIEPGTRMWTQVRRGDLPMPTDDDEADKYEMADVALAAAGYQWYEISNWARPGSQCRHNEAYWSGWDWYGAGPGAHSHLGDVRMWDVKHPVAWARQVALGRLPVAGHEVVDGPGRQLERVMLGIRMRQGLALEELGSGDAGGAGGAPAKLVGVVGSLVAQGLLDGREALRGRAVLTLRGRLMADAVTRALTGD